MPTPTPSLHTRFAALSHDDRGAWLPDLSLVPGDAGDYRALSLHHYRTGRPATMTRILALRHARPTVAGRFLARPSQTRTVGVLVESLPTLSCRLRDEALAGRFAARDPRVRAAMLAREMRCISRVIVDPQWRGLGLAVRLVRAALHDPQTIYTEALAAMGRVHPFFEIAGMTAYDRPPRQLDQRLIDALARLGIDVPALCDAAAVARRLEALDRPDRHWIAAELRRWRTHSEWRHVAPDEPLVEHLRAAQRKLACRPVYYLRCAM